MLLHLKALTRSMLIRVAILPLIFALSLSTCKRHQNLASNQPAASPGESRPTETSSGNSTSPASPSPGTKTAGGTIQQANPGGKVVVDQTAQVIIFCYHRLVEKVRLPGTEITPAMFEGQMKMLKDRGITVIPMQDFLAWRRSEKNIPPRSAIISFDDGWKSQYEVAWPDR